MNNSIALFRRTSFVGVTDKYALPYNISGRGSLDGALNGRAPYDVTGDLMSEDLYNETISRLQRYQYYWDFYNGDQFQNIMDEGEQKLVINYCGTVVDKTVDWFLAKGFKVVASEGNEQVAGFLNKVFEHNDYLNRFQRLLQFGSVTGDSYIYVTLETLTPQGKALPKADWKVRFDPIDPAYVIPYWSASQPGEMSACLIQYPLVYGEQRKTVLFSMFITPEYYETWIDNENKGRKPNPFKKVNVIHIANAPLANTMFGKSDLKAVIPLNEELNIVSNSIRRIIKYHAEPTTVIYGVRASDLEKGAKKVWSNLPKPGEAEVVNLELQGDLKAVFDWFHALKDELSAIAEVPKVIMDAYDQRISNTSGIAIELLFQPIIEKSRRKQVAYKKGILSLCRFIIEIHTSLLGEDVTLLADDAENIYEMDVEFSSPLPRDEAADIDKALKLLDAGIWSKAEAIRRVSGVLDLQRLALELAADTRESLALALETQRANSGQEPVFAAAFLSSVFLSEDLESVAQAEADNGNTADIQQQPAA